MTTPEGTKFYETAQEVDQAVDTLSEVPDKLLHNLAFPGAIRRDLSVVTEDDARVSQTEAQQITQERDEAIDALIGTYSAELRPGIKFLQKSNLIGTL